jgi:hypothetical protein
MEEPFSLVADDFPIRLDWSRITLFAPGLSGEGLYLGPRQTGETRAFEGAAALFDQALLENGMEDRHTLVIQAETPRGGIAAMGRGGASVAVGEIDLQVPAGENEALVMLYEDEAGIVSFHYALPASPASGAQPSRSFGAARYDHFRFKLRSGQLAAGRQGGRGILAIAGKKILKILVKPLECPLGKLLRSAVEGWESSYRSFQGFHSGATLEQLLDARPSTFDSWPDLEGKPALLFLHGTTSSTAGAFEGLKQFPEEFERLARAYEGRVVGFNHHTLGAGVARNVADFYAALPPGRFRFDVVTHSRGGLVARALTGLPDAATAQQLGTPWRRPKDIEVEIDRLIFVATPNGGTEVARPENLSGMVDRLANYVSCLPDSAPVIALPALLALAAAIAERSLQVLPGLIDQAPGSPLLSRLQLRAGDAGRFFALQASYRPDGGLLSALFDGVADRAFSDQANDVVVPTAGVSNIAQFQLDTGRVKEYGHGDKVHHTNFFFQRATVSKLLEFLDV